MSDKPTKNDLTALADCKAHVVGTYIWMPKTMQRLAAKGFVKAIPCTGFPKQTAYALTKNGLAVLGLCACGEPADATGYCSNCFGG